MPESAVTTFFVELPGELDHLEEVAIELRTLRDALALTGNSDLAGRLQNLAGKLSMVRARTIRDLREAAAAYIKEK
jgi:hypothetical protein